MLKKLSFVLIPISFAVILSCTFKDKGGPIPPTGTNATTQALTTGSADLKNVDVPSASTTYCNQLPNDPTNSSLAFGCFLTQGLLLTQNTTVSAILTSLGASPISLNTDILGPGSPFDPQTIPFIADPNRFPFFNYDNFNFPFASNFKQSGTLAGVKLHGLTSAGLFEGKLRLS